MNKRRVLSGTYGFAIAILSIWLDERGMKLASQIVAITALALVGPVGIAIIQKKVGKAPFWIALACCTVLHVLMIWRFLPSLPFPDLGIAILFGGVECFVLGVLAAVFMEALQFEVDSDE